MTAEGDSGRKKVKQKKPGLGGSWGTEREADLNGPRVAGGVRQSVGWPMGR